MKIRKATIEDTKGIAIVQVDTWETTYRGTVPDEFLEQMTYESRELKWKEIITNQFVYVAETSDGQIIGYSNGSIERSGKYPKYNGELYAIYILKSYQRIGIGRELLKSIVKEFMNTNIISMSVLVMENNDSRSFYESLGGLKIGRDKLEISGKEFNLIVYGWEDIRSLL